MSSTFYTLLSLRSVSISQINIGRRFHFSSVGSILGSQGADLSVYFPHPFAGWMEHKAGKGMLLFPLISACDFWNRLTQSLINIWIKGK